MKPFCGGSPAVAAAFTRWLSRLEASGITPTESDDYVVALAARAEVRLAEAMEATGRCRDDDRRLRLVAQERLLALDVQRALDQLQRVFGSAASEAVQEARTGTDGGRVVAFPVPARGGLSPIAQRIVNAARGGATKADLRKRVRGGQGDFLRGVKEALAGGALRRRGAGTKSAPFVYESEGS